MSHYQSDFLHTLETRGFIHQCTDGDTLDTQARDKTITAYIGFDATANSLHVGSLLPIMMLRHLQRTGHKPVVLMGGGTTKIGDPSGKDEARQLLTDDDINSNIAGIRRVFEKFLTFGDGPTDAMMVNNADWLDELAYIPLLREVGRHFTINRMLSFDSVKLRLDREQPLTFLEFNYMILQAYDFVELNKRFGVTLQMGGSDQWGNIVNGVELGRRMHGMGLEGLTTPLLTTASGAKMGKTADGAVWLNEERLSAYDYYQYWRNTEDADVGRFLKLFTELPLENIAELAALEGQDINEAKKILAFEATKMCHGEAAATQAADTARQTFEQGSLGADIPRLDVSRDALAAGIRAVDLFVDAGLTASKGEARRLIKGGGGKVDGKALGDPDATIDLSAVNDSGDFQLSAGKKKHVRVVVNG
ncbi:MAG: tyrosine--tRNA ligase [Pseudomonadota bacterium]